MLVIAIISVMAGSAFLVLTNVQKNTLDTKLMHDVAAINQALTTYRNSGGTVNGLTDPQDVLDRLKTHMKATDAVAMAGLRKGMVDPRLAVRLQTSVEATGSDERAYYRPDTKTFALANSGGQGVKEFFLDESLALKDYGEDNRRSTFDLAKVSPWVWDYTNQPAPAKPAPAAHAATSPSASSGKPGEPPGALKLNAPGFSVATGNFPLTTYPLTLNLTNPNPTGSSNILYSINSGNWAIYTQTLKLNPGQTVQAMAGSLDPDNWLDSDKKQESYTSAPITPALELAFSKSSYSYADLGGPMIPGTAPAPTGGKYGTLTLSNASAIPLAYQSSDYFNAKWTKDGTSPLTSGTAATGDNFSNGFNGQKIAISLADFGTGVPLVIKAATNAADANILNVSGVISKQLGIEQLTLRAPLVSIADRTVTLKLDTQYTDIPVGARLLYTTDGSDPTPTTAQTYTAPFALTGGSGTTVKLSVRVYPPAAYNAWFLPSAAAKQDVALPASTEFYVGGNFYLTKGGSPASRNIARLKGEGVVDSSFDVGAGTTPNSLVGVIRQVSAGQVFAGGDFDAVNNIARPAVVRLNPNGSVDASFNAGLAGGK